MDGTPHRGADATVRLRRPTIAAAPPAVLGLMGAAAALALVLWATWPDQVVTTTWWLVFAVSALVAVGGFVATAGCFVQLRGDDVADVVCWRTRCRFDRRDVTEVRVARGVWRIFVVELGDGTVLSLLGACPEQFPSRLVPGSRDRDLADIDLLVGEEP